MTYTRRRPLTGWNDLDALETGSTTRLQVEQEETRVRDMIQDATKETTELTFAGAMVGMSAGGVRLDPSQGLVSYQGGIRKSTVEPDGDVFIGSNIDTPEGRIFGIFANAQAWNGEEMDAGDMLIGNNSEDTSNVKWDAVEQQFQFRLGTTITAYMDADGTLNFESGTIGGFVIDADSITDLSGLMGMSSAVTGGTDIRFWAGHTTPSSAPFQVTETGALTSTSGIIGGWTIESGQMRSYSFPNLGIVLDGSLDAVIKVGSINGNHIQIDGANQRIRSSNYSAGLSGFNIAASTGDAEFNNITARGELKTFLFTASNQMAVAGNIIVSKDAGKLGAAVASGATSVDFGKSMTVGDWIKIQGPDSAGNNNLEWMLVGSLVSGTTYNVTRDVDGSGANGWLKDTPFVVIGQDGDSRIELMAGASGSLQLITQGSAWNTQTVQASMSTSAGAILAGGGNVAIDAGGITFENGDASQYLVFKDSSGANDKMFIHSTDDDALAISNYGIGNAVRLHMKQTDGTARLLQFVEDAANDNVAQLDIDIAGGAAKITLGGAVSIWADKDGTETVFNEDSFDINFRVESATNTHAINMDAGAEYVSFFGDNSTGIVIIDGGAEERLEIGADHYIPTRDSSNPNGIWNEANQDMDFTFESVSQSELLKLDAGANKSTSFNWDGWAKRDETWTRTGTHTFTVSGDVTATYRKGTKVRYDDGATEYGVIGSSSHAAGTTTVNLIPNSNYAMAATTITETYISYVENPEGFPQWFDYAVAWGASGSMTFTSVTTNYSKWTTSGKTIKVVGRGFGTTGGTANVSLTASLPVNTVLTDAFVGTAYVADGGAALAGFCLVSSNLINGRKTDSSNYGLGASRFLIFDVTYEF